MLNAGTIAKTVTIGALKMKMRTDYIAYNQKLDGFDCGAKLAANISADVAQLARKVNETAKRLQELDPGFPKDWTPLPEG